jgi:hypothetical protein
MAEKSNKDSGTQQTSDATSNLFNKGLIKDYDATFMPEGSWYHARNLINNSISGDLGVVGNEPANFECAKAPYTIIGSIPIIQDYFAIFSTDDTNSEIGLFHQPSCTYTPIVNDPCLAFNRQYLIIGQSKSAADCSFDLYWDDALNPSRTMNIGDVEATPYPNVYNNEPWPGVPYICQNPVFDPEKPNPLDGSIDCYVCNPQLPLQLDCEKIRLAKLMRIPCVTIQKGISGGQLPNGSYYAVIAYSDNQERVTDYFNPSEIQPLFDHRGVAGSLDINFTNLDKNAFDEFQLVIVSTINQQTVAKIIGYYSTQTNAVSIDNINPELESVPIQYIPLRTPAYEKSEGMYAVNGYLIRTAPTGRFDFNYQPLANQISVDWVMVEQPHDYYEKGGNVNGYMRDEQYAFWIRWIYNTGERSSSYHIPGRPPFAWELDPYGNNGSGDSIYANEKKWQVLNTAFVDPYLPTPPDFQTVVPGQVIARGKMGYWESTEWYPADKPDVWNSSAHTWSQVDTIPYLYSQASDYDLCGKHIRHHKMPADALYANGSGADATGASLYPNDNFSHVRVRNEFQNPNTGLFEPAKPMAIRVLGVEFHNIRVPVDNYGDVIPGIVGYEILRSSRQGNRTILAKGIINNMRSYKSDPLNSALSESIYYPNYVGNYLGADPTLTEISNTSVGSGIDPVTNEFIIINTGAGTVNSTASFNRRVSSNFFTFHSPDTTFDSPFLNPSEIKIYGERGNPFNMDGKFEPVPGHPKEKLLSNNAFIIAGMVGIAMAARSVRGRDTRTIKGPQPFNAGVQGSMLGQGSGTISSEGIGTNGTAAQPGYAAAVSAILNALTIATTGQDPSATVLTNAYEVADGLIDNIASTIGIGAGGIGSAYDTSVEWSDNRYMPNYFKGLGGIITFGYYWSQGTDATLDLIQAIVPFKEYVYRSISHLDLAYYRQGNAVRNNTRRPVKEALYLDNQFQYIGTTKVNNLFRSKCVALELERPLLSNYESPSIPDYSVQTIGNVISAGTATNAYLRNQGISWSNPSSGKFISTTSAFYAGLKVAYDNQYGQIDSPKQITTGCVFEVKQGAPLVSSDVTRRYSARNVFGGDVYIGRYTEKNTFFYFYDWLYNVPTGFEIDYKLRYMVNYPRFFADFTRFETSEFVRNFTNNLNSSIFDNDAGATLAGSGLAAGLPTSKYNLDQPDYNSGSSLSNLPAFGNNFASLRLSAQNGYMYLFQSGVRDFFVESEYNVDQRDWGDNDVERFYDPYNFTDLQALFETSIIKAGNYYKYDISLGVSKVFNSFISWGSMQNRSYDPYVAESCYTYYPYRVIYSLPLSFEDRKDYWRIFLVNNYYDFDSRVTAFKSINRNGAIVLQEKASPLMFNAVDTLQTTSGTKITIGDGGLFSQPLQTLSNADPEFQHGSCQDRLSVINTPAGVYWMSATQGKIFTVGEGMQAISDLGMKWWFNKYLKFFLLEQFPGYLVVDNPVVGIGCQATFDNENQVVYFSKKDYRLKEQYVGQITCRDNRTFRLGKTPITLGDPLYFDDLSWTISYDPKLKAWLSFHDWKPEIGISSIKGFMTTKTATDKKGGIWVHTINTTNKFCNFYGVDYPFEIDYVSQTGQAVTTTRSIEYLLECYVYDQFGIDKYEVIDFNFDNAVVYNNEQVSGNLRLNLSPKNNAPVIVNYPQINTVSSIIEILFSKEEQKYRFNQFWDVTRDRGEFQTGGVLVQQPIWDTELNGYIRNLNPNNIDLNKSPFQRKKFRHYANHVLLTRSVSDNVKMLLKVTNNKLLNSPR